MEKLENCFYCLKNIQHAKHETKSPRLPPKSCLAAKCAYCKLAIPFKYHYKHELYCAKMREITKNDGKQCKICQNSFTNVLKHMKTVHHDVVFLPQKSQKSQYNENSKMKTAKDEPKSLSYQNYACKYCKKLIHPKMNLGSHMRFCSKFGKFAKGNKCLICDKKFKKRDTLLRHMKTKHSSPYYTHLGVASSLENLRTLMEKRCGVTGNALRIEKAVYCAREGKSKLGCPIAKYIIRRTSQNEKFLVVAKCQIGENGDNIWIVISIIAWDGVPVGLADHAYNHLSGILGLYGRPFHRQCESNSKKNCGCQGKSDRNEQKR